MQLTKIHYNIYNKPYTTEQQNKNRRIKNASIAFKAPYGKPFSKLGKFGVPDMYTPKILIYNEEIQTLINSGVLNGCSSKAIQALEPFEARMQETELKVFKILKRLSKRFPDENLQQLMQRIKPKYEQRLIKKQIPILKNILSLGKDLQPQYHKELYELFRQTKKQIFHCGAYKAFTNTNFSKRVSEIMKKAKNPKLYYKMMKETEKLPSSFSYVPSFIVKYARRTPEKIGIGLLDTSRLSIEHLLAYSCGGDNSLKNYALASKGWNTYFHSKKLYDRILEKPQMRTFIHKQVRLLKKLANQGEMDGQALVEVIKTFEKESLGLIKIQTSDIDTSAYIKKHKAQTETERFIGLFTEYGIDYFKKAPHYIPKEYKLINNCITQLNAEA